MLPTFATKCRKIICVGRNYQAHAIELGNKVMKPGNDPILFLKPPSSFLPIGKSIVVPAPDHVIHHEVELGIVIGKPEGKVGKNIDEKDAHLWIKGYFLGLDMTNRTVQDKAKKAGLPWSVAKGYDTFAPVSEMIDPSELDSSNTSIWLKVDGELKQQGNTQDMMYSVPFLISYISTIFKLEENDCIYTGTPSGVGPVLPGQTITCGIEGNIDMTFSVIANSNI